MKTPHAPLSYISSAKAADMCRRVNMKLVGLVLVFCLAIGATLAALLGSPMYMGPRAYDQPLNDTSPAANETNSGPDSVEPLPIVTTAQGVLRGRYMLTRRGKIINAFKGVRFAKPPVGNLRFKSPVPPDSWEGIRGATEDGYACPQEVDYVIPTNEDCLFLSVYTRRLPSKRHNPKYPVLVWIHAGGWYGGTGVSALHGPQYLMDEDIVLVSINYRLGALGFLSTGDGVIPGNFGLKDQVMALKWVQENILAFGGNPGRVTLGGYSAGAASVWFHLASPLSRGLFHQAISMSPSINAQYDVSSHTPLQMAKRQAAILDCPHNSSQEIYDCLMQIPAEDISGSIFKLTDWAMDPILIFYPVIEPKSDENTDRFLDADMAQLILSGNFSHVPWIIGHTRNEFDWKASSVLGNDSWKEDMNDHFNEVAPLAFMYGSTRNNTYISEALRKFYLHDEPISSKNMVGLGKVYSDSIINFGTNRAANVISGLSTKPVFYYKFDYQGRYSFVYKAGTTKPYGVMHQDDSMYLFYMSILFPFFQPDDPEIATLERLTTMWGNFIKTGHPTPKHRHSSLINVNWEPLKPDDLWYLDIGRNLKMKKGLYQDRMDVWGRLFPLPKLN